MTIRSSSGSALATTGTPAAMYSKSLLGSASRWFSQLSDSRETPTSASAVCASSSSRATLRQDVDAVGGVLGAGERTELGGVGVVGGAQQHEVDVRHARDRADEDVATAPGSRRALVQDERLAAPDAQARPQALPVRAPGCDQIAHVAQHDRARAQRVACAQPVGDPVGHRDDARAARHERRLEHVHEPFPGTRAVLHAGRELMGVIDKPRARQPRDERAGQQHRRVVGVHDVGPHGAAAGDERREEHQPVRRERQQPPDPWRRQRGAAAKAVELLVTGAQRDELDDRHGVAGAGECGRLASHT